MHRVAFLVLILGGFQLQLRALGQFTFSADEAVYSAWALHAFHGDPWFLAVWPDKPPLFLWVLGSAFLALGNRPETAQLLNIGLSTLTVVVTGVTACRLWGAGAGIAAAGFLALNPFALSFAPTAFTDPMLVLLGMLALAAAVRGRALWAGVWLGAAIMTKQQGLLYVPLIAGALWLSTRAAPAPRHWYRLTGGLLLVGAPVVLWDSLRWQVAPSPWDLSVRNYGAITPAAPGTWAPRTALWWDQLYFLHASTVTWALVAVALVGASMVAWRTRPTRRADMAVLLALWATGYLTLHLLSTIQVWDRYLLPLAPALALLSAWAVSVLGRAWPRAAMLFTLLLLLSLARPAVTAATGGLPVGGDKGAYTGLPAALAWLDDHMEAPYVLYHNRLGWHYRYYRFTERAAGHADLRWFPSTTYLADNAEKTPHRPKFYVEPMWSARPDLVQRLAMRGLSLTAHGQFGQFMLYEITAAAPARVHAAPRCDWCVSRAEAATARGHHAFPVLTDAAGRMPPATANEGAR